MRPAFVGMSIVAAGVFLFLLLPLVTFFGELLTNPDMMVWEWSIEPGEEGSKVLRVSLLYNGSVSLSDVVVKINVGGVEHVFQKELLAKGDRLVAVIQVPVEVQESKFVFSMSFRIAGIYGFSLGVANG